MKEEDPSAKNELSRRNFLKRAGALVVAFSSAGGVAGRAMSAN